MFKVKIKRILNVFILLTFVISLFPISVNATVSSNLLSNGDFESGNNNWLTMTTDRYEFTPTPEMIVNDPISSANGDYHASMFSAYNSMDYMFSDSFVIPPNSVYLTLSFNGLFYKLGDCSGQTNEIFVSFYDNDSHDVIETQTIHNAATKESDLDYSQKTIYTTTNLSDRVGHSVEVDFITSNDNPECYFSQYLDDINVTAAQTDDPAHTPIYRLYNTLNGAYLYTRGDPDRVHVLGTWSEFEFTDGIPAFYGSLVPQVGYTPIYRLYNTKNGAYLYTRGDADKNHVMSTWPEFEFTDGVPAFYAPLTNLGPQIPAPDPLTPIYRLYNTKNGMYLYTRGEADRQHVMSTWPEFEFTDGVPAFYAPLTYTQIPN